MGGLNDGVNDSMKDTAVRQMDDALIPSETVMAFDEDLEYGDTPYDPFDRPAGEIIVQVCPRSRSPRRSRSV